MTSESGAAALTSQSNDNPEPGKGPKKKWVMLAAVTTFLLVVLFILGAEDTVDVTERKDVEAVQLVSVEIVSVAPAKAVVTAFAEVRPRWSAEIRAAVSGRVLAVTQNGLSGERVATGAELIQIENSQYVADLAAANHDLAQARLALRRAQNNTAIKRREFERAGSTPPSDLALHLPELRIAETALTSAETRAAAAERRLADATIVAPFSGYITARLVSPGQAVNVGDPLVKIVDDSTYELTVELGRRDWDLLDQPLAGKGADVLDARGEVIAQARIRRGGGFLDETTRQFKVFLEITEASTGAVLSGDFVRVALPGQMLERTLDIPESALSQEGYVWHIDADDRLVRMVPRVLFRTSGRIVIAAPDSLTGSAADILVATTPLASFLPGQKVRIQDGED